MERGMGKDMGKVKHMQTILVHGMEKVLVSGMDKMLVNGMEMMAMLKSQSNIQIVYRLLLLHLKIVRKKRHLKICTRKKKMKQIGLLSM